MKSKNSGRLLITLMALFATVAPMRSQEREKGWRTWIRVSPCVDTPHDWIITADEPPTFGGIFYDPAANHLGRSPAPGNEGKSCNDLHPFGCTYEQATAEALHFQKSPNFENYCCKVWHVWKNVHTNEFRLVRGSDTIKPTGWKEEAGPMCCRAAEAMSGLVGVCGGSTTHAGGGCSACFESDPGAGSRNRSDHFNWARSRSAREIENNLKKKLDMVVNCPSATDDDVTGMYASFSTALARNTNAACFPGDPGSARTDYASHEMWALANDRAEILDYATWKVETAFRCLKPGDEAGVFADLSVEISKCAGSGGPVVRTATPVVRRSTPRRTPTRLDEVTAQATPIPPTRTPALGGQVWDFVSVTNNLQTWGNTFTKTGESSVHMDQGANKADFQWSAPPQRFGGEGFNVSMSVQASPGPGNDLSTEVHVYPGRGMDSETPVDQRTLYVTGRNGASASGQGSVKLKPTLNAQEIEFDIGFNWGPNFKYKYRRVQ